MKTTLLISALFVLLVPTAFSQEDTSANSAKPAYQASMEGWEVDLNVAWEESQKTGKPILANFTGTDWCGWCIRLKAAVFTTDEFKNWADTSVVLLELDFPKRFKVPDHIAQQNSELARAFGIQGYPTIWVFDLTKNDETGQANIQALGKTGYGPDPTAWIEDIAGKIEKSRAKLEKGQEE